MSSNRNPFTQKEDESEQSLEKRTNPFDELQTRELDTQWQHKVSAIPESEGITTKWWEYSAGVVREGPEAKVPPGEDISTTESGEYTVGDPALAGGAYRIEGVAQDGDDSWVGYSNRLNKTAGNGDGAGVGYKYFDVGEGDLGGAKTEGPQEYAWFRSAVPGVSDKEVPRDRWNGESVADIPVGDLFRRGGFVREPFTFYDQGFAKLNYGIKTEDGLDVRTLHTFTVENNPMWQQSDLKWQGATSGTNVDGFINATHFKSGEVGNTIRGNGEIRDGTISGGSVSVSSGTAVPLISVQLRDGWENVNLRLGEFNVDMNDSFYVFISLNTDVNNATFDKPLNDVSGIDQTSSEYAVNTDVDSDGFADAGEIEYITSVSSSGGFSSSTADDSVPRIGLPVGAIVTLGIIPIDATAFNSASLNWRTNF